MDWFGSGGPGAVRTGETKTVTAKTVTHGLEQFGLGQTARARASWVDSEGRGKAQIVTLGLGEIYRVVHPNGYLRFPRIALLGVVGSQQSVWLVSG